MSLHMAVMLNACDGLRFIESSCDKHQIPTADFLGV